MPKMLQDLVVVAKHGDDYIQSCLDSLGTKYEVKVIDTSEGGHPTGAYLKAYKKYPAKNYFFMQDSMQALQKDYLEPFKEVQPEGGAVAWAHFYFGFDNAEQEAWLRRKYYGDVPFYGTFGPIFYISRRALEKLDSLNLLPDIPMNKLQAQGTERAWAWAFKIADIPCPAVGNIWYKEAMQRGEFPVFKKAFGGRV